MTNKRFARRLSLANMKLQTKNSLSFLRSTTLSLECHVFLVFRSLSLYIISNYAQGGDLFRSPVNKSQVASKVKPIQIDDGLVAVKNFISRHYCDFEIKFHHIFTNFLN